MSDELAPNRATERRARLGLALIGVGIAGILWGVFHVLEAVPGPEQLDFAHRTTDYEARKAVHESFAGGFARAMAGLAVALLGGWIRNRALRESGGAR